MLEEPMRIITLWICSSFKEGLMVIEHDKFGTGKAEDNHRR